MKCSKAEKLLYGYSGGSAEQNLPAEVLAHVQSCERCSRLFEQVRSVNTVLAETPEAELIPQEDVERMVSAGLLKQRTSVRRENAWEWLRGLPVPGVAAVLTAVLAAATVGWYSGWIFSWSSHPARAAAAAYNGQHVVTASFDSTLRLGRNCTAHLRRGSRCTIRRAEETVAIIDLHYGKILLSARKGSYDTLAVTSGPVHVYATGTHFQVERFGPILNVSVLEGSVKVHYGPEKAAPVSAGETWAFDFRENSGKADTLGPGTRLQMVNDFAAMSAAETRLGLSTAETGGAPDPAIASTRISPARASRPGRTFTEDSAVIRQYAIAKSMIGKRRYGPAAAVLQECLEKLNANADSACFDLAFCYTNLRRYADAVAVYRRVVDSGVDEELVETALHRSNKILYLKLKEYDAARGGIRRYLKTYPKGLWREEELYYGIHLSFTLGDTPAADSLSLVFAAEFPGSCRARELLKKAEKSPQ